MPIRKEAGSGVRMLGERYIDRPGGSVLFFFLSRSLWVSCVGMSDIL